MTENPSVRHEPEQHRFVLELDGTQAGVVQYEEDGDTWALTHTIVDDAFEGRGLGSTLARAALDSARENGKRVDPQCPFIAKYVTKHDDWNDLLV